MKKTILMLLIALVGMQTAQAQAYKNSKYYNPKTHRLDYNRTAVDDHYFGLRLGAAFTNITSKSDAYKANGAADLNIGFVYGQSLSYNAPVYLEAGVAYTAKGGKANLASGEYEYNLNYLELPVVAKYKIEIDEIDGFSIDPFFGGYLACGIGGQIKNYTLRTSEDSFSDAEQAFRSFDGGLRMGVGVSYNALYAELAYDLGLANISHDTFAPAHNHAIMLNIGVNF